MTSMTICLTDSSMRTCLGCKASLPLDSFGKHKSGRDGLRGICKPCAVIAVAKYRQTESGKRALAAYRALDRVKQSISAANSKWLKTEAGKETKRRLQQKFPEKIKARNAINHAISAGIIERLPCINCGAKAEAHHDDYDKPLEVTWLCPVCHKKRHKEIDNAAT